MQNLNISLFGLCFRTFKPIISVWYIRPQKSLYDHQNQDFQCSLASVTWSFRPLWTIFSVKGTGSKDPLDAFHNCLELFRRCFRILSHCRRPTFDLFSVRKIDILPLESNRRSTLLLKEAFKSLGQKSIWLLDVVLKLFRHKVSKGQLWLGIFAFRKVET